MWCMFNTNSLRLRATLSCDCSQKGCSQNYTQPQIDLKKRLGLCKSAICEDTFNFTDELAFIALRWCGRRLVCCCEWWWYWHFWQIAQSTRYFQLVIDLVDTSDQTVRIFVCCLIEHRWCSGTTIATKFTHLHFNPERKRKRLKRVSF